MSGGRTDLQTAVLETTWGNISIAANPRGVAACRLPKARSQAGPVRVLQVRLPREAPSGRQPDRPGMSAPARGTEEHVSRGVRMYAVIKTGGKQYKVAAGEKIKVEQIAADVGQELVIDQVLAVGDGAQL